MTHLNAAVVCAGGMSSSVNAARSLGKKQIPVIGIAFDRSHPLIHSKYCSETYILTDPKENYQKFNKELMKIVSSKTVGTIVPLNPYGIYSITDNYSMYSEELELPIVDPETYKLVWDSMELLSLASDLGIPVPEHALLSDWDFSEAPTVVKARYSIIEEENKLYYPGVNFLPPTSSIHKSKIIDSMGHEPVLQRYVDNGTEFGFFALFENGEPLVTFQHKRVRSTNYFGGASSHRKATYNSTIEKYGLQLLKELNWTGPAMVEFRRNDDTGEYKLMEINPRFWGSLILGISAGIDFPYLYYQLAMDDDLSLPQDYDTSAKASYIRAELQHLQSLLLDDYPDFVEKPSIPQSLIEMVRSVPGASFDMFSFDDPAPFFWDYAYSISRILGQK